MRDKKRIKRITDSLYKLWLEHPDMRLGQLLENYIFQEEMKHKMYRSLWIRTPTRPANCIFHIKDDIIEQRLKDHYKKVLINNGEL